MRSRERRSAAAALSFDSQAGGAPTVAASGHGALAERILAAARDAGVPVRHDPLLADALAILQADTEIPEELYVAVAEALVWAWEADRRTGRPTPPAP